MIGIPPPPATPPQIIRELAEDGYLPLAVGRSDTLAWRAGAPAILKTIAARWRWTDPQNPFVRSALYAFEQENGLPLQGISTDGEPPLLASTMLFIGSGKPARQAWSWVFVHRARHGETVTLYRWRGSPGGGAGFVKVLTTPANSGYLNTTPFGTWTIYRRDRVTSMSGTALVPVSLDRDTALRARHQAGLSWNALGVTMRNGRLFHNVHYDDHGVKWVSYFYHGDALHYLARAHYGFPQSAGCVEMPEAAAKEVWRATYIGSSVTVSPLCPSACPKPAQRPQQLLAQR